MKPIAWYDPTNGMVSTDKDSPLFTPLGQLLPLYTKQEDDGITLTTIRHPRGKPALGSLNPESLETMEIDVPVPVAWGVFEGNLHDMFFSQEEAQKMADLKGTHAEVRPLYAPPQRTWVGMTKEERHEISLSKKPYVADIMAAHEEELKRRNE
jgi:hypothetical protein